jgi:hypothetical protein
MSGFSHRSPTKVKPRVAGAPRTLGLEFLERHYEGVGVERQAHARVAELCRHLSHRHTAPDVHARVAMARGRAGGNVRSRPPCMLATSRSRLLPGLQARPRYLPVLKY